MGTEICYVKTVYGYEPLGVMEEEELKRMLDYCLMVMTGVVCFVLLVVCSTPSRPCYL